jgi:antitoxin (DNA-binding transcriptional repressor) of toxin-antitoxin stability system
MKTATVRDLRNRFKQVSNWLEAGETVQILKRGKPFARVVPEKRGKGLLGCMSGTGEIPPDIDDPLPIEWDAAR